MTKRAGTGNVDATLRVLAAVLGTLPVALVASVCLARFLPLAEATRFAIGISLSVPLWVAAMCFVFLARSGWRALGACLTAALLFSLFAYALPR